MNPFESNIKKYYAYYFFRMFVVLIPFIIAYMGGFGFSMTQLMLIVGGMSVTITLMEIPSGYLADRIGRKNILILGAAINIISATTFYFSESFIGFLLGEIFLGLAISCFSGADTALVYDSLLEIKKEKEFKKIESKRVWISEISVILASILGTIIVKYYNMRMTILATLIISIPLFIITLTFHEPKKKKEKKRNFLEEITNLKNVVMKSIRHKELLSLFIYLFFVLGISNTIFVFNQPYFVAVNVDPIYFGIIFAVFSMVTGITGYFTTRLEKKLGMKGSLILNPILLIATLIGLTVFFGKIGIVFFLLREFVRGFIFPTTGDYVNRLIESKDRATVNSVGSMFSRMGYLITALIYGVLTDLFSMQAGIFSLAILLIIPSIITITVMNKKSKKISTI